MNECECLNVNVRAECLLHGLLCHITTMMPSCQVSVHPVMPLETCHDAIHFKNVCPKLRPGTARASFYSSPMAWANLKNPMYTFRLW